eukprot:TRINITY_DN14633_c0_g1_i2.p1 TRINITY_DN14633_c0_g1~~TRINITY_DN14633_c0_g1_i2.p1  ORF type:complete len:100 (-),score=6.92 TRINITY_DN14633_c0_g1_i2:54-314(-)
MLVCNVWWHDPPELHFHSATHRCSCEQRTSLCTHFHCPDLEEVKDVLAEEDQLKAYPNAAVLAVRYQPQDASIDPLGRLMSPNSRI